MEDLLELENTLNYRFRKKDLLLRALTHSSYTTSPEKRTDNEKLEFLGDAVLNLVVTLILLEKYKDKNEGFLSNARAALVKRETLTEIGKRINLEKFIRYEDGISPYDSKIISNLLEALFAAIYLDGGLRKVKSVIKRLFSSYLSDERLSAKNPKNLLQEFTQKHLGLLPRYRAYRKGKNGFSVLCFVDDTYKARGAGKTKKEAEIEAARKVLNLIGAKLSEEDSLR